MREIVEFFLADLGDRIKDISSAVEASDRARLKTLAHQLKGAAGGYGFPTIGTAAAAVERDLLQEQSSMEEVRGKVDYLISLCMSAIPTAN